MCERRIREKAAVRYCHRCYCRAIKSRRRDINRTLRQYNLAGDGRRNTFYTPSAFAEERIILREHAHQHSGGSHIRFVRRRHGDGRELLHAKQERHILVRLECLVIHRYFNSLDIRKIWPESNLCQSSSHVNESASIHVFVCRIDGVSVWIEDVIISRYRKGYQIFVVHEEHIRNVNHVIRHNILCHAVWHENYSTAFHCFIIDIYLHVYVNNIVRWRI